LKKRSKKLFLLGSCTPGTHGFWFFFSKKNTLPETRPMIRIAPILTLLEQQPIRPLRLIG